MNEKKLNKLQEVINDQLDLIEMNVARINNKDYFGLDFELLKYIRNLENQLDIANKKLEDIKKYLLNIKDEPDADMYMKLGEYDFHKDILAIIGDK